MLRFDDIGPSHGAPLDESMVMSAWSSWVVSMDFRSSGFGVCAVEVLLCGVSDRYLFLDGFDYIFF